MTDRFFKFYWTICKYNLLNARKEAGFFLDYPTVTRWTVQVEPSSPNSRSLTFSLKCKPLENEAVAAERLEMVVLLDEAEISRNGVNNYVFNNRSNYRYTFDVLIPEHIDSQSNLFKVNTKIKLSRGGNAGARVVRNGAEISLFWGGDVDTSDLIAKFRRCLESGLYSTISVNGHRVHHYILRERWTNFFDLENVVHDTDSVTTDISNRVVGEILHYMYTGNLSRNFPRKNATYITELFQVIFHYRIFHFYKVLMPHTSMLYLRSGNDVADAAATTSLNFVENVAPVDHSVIISMYPKGPENAESHFLFSVNAKHMSICGPWLSFTLKSYAQIPFHVQVSLETTLDGIKRVIDYQDFDVPAFGTVESREILFLGSSHVLGVDPSASPSTAIHPDLKFKFKFYDGSLIFEYYTYGPDEKNKGLSTEILCDHMHHVLEQEYLSDLGVSTTDTGNGPEAKRHRIHKGIFNARVPAWQNVAIPPVPEDAPLPNEIKLPVNDESWNRIASYMYTGKLLPVPRSLRNEMRNFAIISHFESLQNLIDSHWDELN